MWIASPIQSPNTPREYINTVKYDNKKNITPLRLLNLTITILTAKFPQSLISFISGFENSGSAFSFAKGLYGLMTSGPKAIKFQAGGLGATSSSQQPFLQTYSGSFQQGSSVAHLDYQSNYKGPDFLMVPSIQNLTGLTLDAIISQNTNNGTLAPMQIYGPGTMAIMSSLGWPTPSTTTIQSIAINPNQNGGASFPASSASPRQNTRMIAIGLMASLVYTSLL